ncbi:mutS protein homolog 4-like isoform X2 [Oscarella lobularis]|uniref:mutS protein homolog 4-like isoform X2 n=1 Tax=Oscarella lobularis TaxID=121494 RepID=UPI003313AE86
MSTSNYGFGAAGPMSDSLLSIPKSGPSSNAASRNTRKRLKPRSGASRDRHKTPRTATTTSYAPASTSSTRDRITTGRTATSTFTSEIRDQSVMIALVEGRGLARGEIGMASIDIKRPELFLSQFADSQTYAKVLTKLQVMNPLEIIMPHTACDGQNVSKLFQLVRDYSPDSNVTTVQRKYFNETKGLEYVKRLCVPEYSTVEMEISTKYYCLAAAAALLKYVEYVQNIVFAPNSVKVEFCGSEQTMMIDVVTVKNLELLVNARDSKSSHSLFGVLNHTKTTSGARLLRANVLQPPCDIETIELRLDCVTELTEKEVISRLFLKNHLIALFLKDLFCNLQTVLSRFLDVDRALASCAHIPKEETAKTAEQRITNIVYVKHTLELVDPLKTALSDAESVLLTAHKELLDDPRFIVMMEHIDRIIHDDTHYQRGTLHMITQKCFAVKPNINGLLDIARQTYTELIDNINSLVQRESVETDLPLRTAYNASRGFFIQMTVGGRGAQQMPDSFPETFIKVVKTKNTVSATTEDLVKLNDRVSEALKEIYLLSNVVMNDLLNDLRRHIGCLYKLTDCVAMLDMLVSFAHVRTLSNYVRPEFTDTLAVKRGRHPVLDKILDDSPIPNNVYVSNDCNFQIITGPNMSGKSTYLRQVAMLHVMAHMGSFVPAEYASFRLTDQLFSRIGSDDDIETNASTFMLEMKEANYILQNVSNRSLIIVDELGRGTSAEEGVGLCHVFCEFLISTKAFTFFVTHFEELTRLDSLYANVENYHFEVEKEMEDLYEKLHHPHLLLKGRCTDQHYGLRLAARCSLPESVVEEAKEIVVEIEERDEMRQGQSPESLKERAVFKLANRLIQAARNSRLDEAGLRLYLANLKQQYEREISSIEYEE